MLHEFLVTEIRGIQSWIDLTLHFRIDFSLLFHLMNSQSHKSLKYVTCWLFMDLTVLWHNFDNWVTWFLIAFWYPQIIYLIWFSFSVNWVNIQIRCLSGVKYMYIPSWQVWFSLLKLYPFLHLHMSSQHSVFGSGQSLDSVGSVQFDPKARL